MIILWIKSDNRILKTGKPDWFWLLSGQIQDNQIGKPVNQLRKFRFWTKIRQPLNNIW